MDVGGVNFEKFKLISIKTEDVLNEYNIVDEYKVNKIKHEVLDAE